MQTVESLRLLPVWLNPGHMVATARIVLSGHKLKAIGVLEGDRLVGMVSSEGVAALPDDRELREAMEPATPVVEASTPIRRVAEMFVDQDIERAPVTKGGKYMGVLTAAMLLKEMRRSWDPLTDLSWSDGLREWAIENLREGREIVVLFIDLNNFGAYNKRYGHVVGDLVLQRMAEMLREHVDPQRGVLVRYGGDEFAMGLVGTQQEGREIADAVRARTGELVVPEAHEPVTFCVGVAGGKRTRERDNVHYFSTISNLINLASQECIAQKRAAEEQRMQAAATVAAPPQPSQPAIQPAPEATPQPQAHPERPRVLSVSADEGPAALTQVVMSIGECVVSGVHARGSGSAIESVATATAKALERGYPGKTFEVRSVGMAEGPSGERLVSVTGVASGKAVIGARAVGQDLFASVADATVEAFLSA